MVTLASDFDFLRIAGFAAGFEVRLRQRLRDAVPTLDAERAANAVGGLLAAGDADAVRQPRCSFGDRAGLIQQQRIHIASGFHCSA